VDELDSVDDLERYTAPPFVCIVEEKNKQNSSAEVSIGMISICPSTGDIVWDDFDGKSCGSVYHILQLTSGRWRDANRARGEFDSNLSRLLSNSVLQTRLVHTRPSELLIPKKHLTEETGKMLSHFTGQVVRYLNLLMLPDPLQCFKLWSPNQN